MATTTDLFSYDEVVTILVTKSLLYYGITHQDKVRFSLRTRHFRNGRRFSLSCHRHVESLASLALPLSCLLSSSLSFPTYQIHNTIFLKDSRRMLSIEASFVIHKYIWLPQMLDMSKQRALWTFFSCDGSKVGCLHSYVCLLHGFIEALHWHRTESIWSCCLACSKSMATIACGANGRGWCRRKTSDRPSTPSVLGRLGHARTHTQGKRACLSSLVVGILVSRIFQVDIFQVPMSQASKRAFCPWRDGSWPFFWWPRNRVCTPTWFQGLRKVTGWWWFALEHLSSLSWRTVRWVVYTCTSFGTAMGITTKRQIYQQQRQ